MKILVLMPLDEKNTYTAAGIYKALPAKVKDITFSMPMFMDYIGGTKASSNWTFALFDAILSAEQVYKTAQKEKQHLIVLGNMPKEYKFDLIVNCQDLLEALPYEDLFVKKNIELIGQSEISDEEKVKLLQKLNLHGAEESVLSMFNGLAIADFLTAYLETDIDLESIKEDYEEKLKQWTQSQKSTILN